MRALVRGGITPHVHVIGAGLAGCEAAYQLASRGIRVTLHEMRPAVMTPAHRSGDLAELVCSNSLKSRDATTAAGALKLELAAYGSALLRCAEQSAVPAGGALAVDRARFSAAVAASLGALPGLSVVRDEVTSLPDGDVIVATGPLTSPSFEPVLSRLVGPDRLAFFDAAAPIVDGGSIDRAVAFPASRYGKGEGADYLNCPMDRQRYEAFHAELVRARRVVPRDFEPRELFQACQPVEEVARSGMDALRFGALKPVGIVDPVTGLRPWAVVQLRAEDRAGAAFNLVGFQTSLAFDEQRRVFGMIPGLEHAEFLRFGVMHRNTFVDSPQLLAPDLSLRADPRVRLAGQLTGTEGYVEAVASGLLAALGAFAAIEGLPPVTLPPETVFGALVARTTSPATVDHQPMHVNLGIVPPLEHAPRGKRERRAALTGRAADEARGFVACRPDLRFDLVADPAAPRVAETRA